MGLTFKSHCFGETQQHLTDFLLSNKTIKQIPKEIDEGRAVERGSFLRRVRKGTLKKGDNAKGSVIINTG